MDIVAEKAGPCYRAISTYHLNDKRLSLAAKGLLTMILCYQRKGLTTEILAESAGEIDSTIDELEEMGYLSVDDETITAVEMPSKSAKVRKARQKKNTTFIPPTVEEVAEYIKEKDYHFSAEEFVAHYESNGWKVGKVKMQKWKAACATFEHKWKEKNPKVSDYDDAI